MQNTKHTLIYYPFTVHIDYVIVFNYQQDKVQDF